VEVVELLAINSSIHDIPSVQMFAWTQTHSEYTVVRHLVDQLLTDLFHIRVSHISNGSKRVATLSQAIPQSHP
jgi:hypothetical protein